MEDQEFKLKITVRKKLIVNPIDIGPTFKLLICAFYCDSLNFSWDYLFSELSHINSFYFSLINKFVLPPSLEDQIKEYLSSQEIFNKNKLIL